MKFEYCFLFSDFPTGCFVVSFYMVFSMYLETFTHTSIPKSIQSHVDISSDEDKVNIANDHAFFYALQSNSQQKWEREKTKEILLFIFLSFRLASMSGWPDSENPWHPSRRLDLSFLSTPRVYLFPFIYLFFYFPFSVSLITFLNFVVFNLIYWFSPWPNRGRSPRKKTKMW